MGTQYKLYHYWRSSCSWRVRWALALKNIPCEFIPVNLLTDEPESSQHLSRNPMGYVPVLELPPDPNLKSGVSKPRYLCESVAIIEYLDEIYPTPVLIPGDAYQKARIRQLTEIINSGTQPLQNLNVSQHHSTDADEQKKWNQFWIRKGLESFEVLAKETTGTFSWADTITLADLVLIPQCYNAQRNGIELGEFPIIERIFNNAMKTESCQASAPDKFQPQST